MAKKKSKTKTVKKNKKTRKTSGKDGEPLSSYTPKASGAESK